MYQMELYMWIAEVLAKHTAALLMLLSFPSSVSYEIWIIPWGAPSISWGANSWFYFRDHKCLDSKWESSAIFQIRFKNNLETEVSYWIHLFNSSLTYLSNKKKIALTTSKTNLTFFLSSHKDFMTKGCFWIVSCLCGHSCYLNLPMCY